MFRASCEERREEIRRFRDWLGESLSDDSEEMTRRYGRCYGVDRNGERNRGSRSSGLSSFEDRNLLWRGGDDHSGRGDWRLRRMRYWVFRIQYGLHWGWQQLWYLRFLIRDTEYWILNTGAGRLRHRLPFRQTTPCLVPDGDEVSVSEEFLQPRVEVGEEEGGGEAVVGAARSTPESVRCGS